ncbi:MAG: hypothetical protein R3325_13060 [Thermoanaerobaculia bacterium]|nr:hypothetical protein [Thermoanaerobaculia bacterium]
MKREPPAGSKEGEVASAPRVEPTVLGAATLALLACALLPLAACRGRALGTIEGELLAAYEAADCDRIEAAATRLEAHREASYGHIVPRMACEGLEHVGGDEWSLAIVNASGPRPAPSADLDVPAPIEPGDPGPASEPAPDLQQASTRAIEALLFSAGLAEAIPLLPSEPEIRWSEPVVFQPEGWHELFGDEERGLGERSALAAAGLPTRRGHLVVWIEPKERTRLAWLRAATRALIQEVAARVERPDPFSALGGKGGAAIVQLPVWAEHVAERVPHSDLRETADRMVRSALASFSGGGGRAAMAVADHYAASVCGVPGNPLADYAEPPAPGTKMGGALPAGRALPEELRATGLGDLGYAVCEERVPEDDETSPCGPYVNESWPQGRSFQRKRRAWRLRVLHLASGTVVGDRIFLAHEAPPCPRSVLVATDATGRRLSQLAAYDQRGKLLGSGWQTVDPPVAAMSEWLRGVRRSPGGSSG